MDYSSLVQCFDFLYVSFSIFWAFVYFPSMIEQEPVVMHWACSKITAASTIQDAPLLEMLLEKV